MTNKGNPVFHFTYEAGSLFFSKYKSSLVTHINTIFIYKRGHEL